MDPDEQVLFENKFQLSNQEPGHTTGRSRQGSAQQGCKAGRGEEGQDADRTVRTGDGRPY